MVENGRPQMATAIAAIATPITTAKAHLLKAPVTITPDTPLSAITPSEADFTGYAAKTVGALGTPYVDPSTLYEVVDGVALVFIMTDTVAPNTIYGAYITDSGGTELLGFETFPTPIPLAVAGAGLTYTPVFQIKP